MREARRRVVITGMGSVTAAGNGVDALWKAVRDGVTGVKPFELAGTNKQRVRIAAHIPDFDPVPFVDAETLRMVDRFAAFALVAAHEAVSQAGFSASGDRFGERCGVVIGTGIGGATTTDDGHERFYRSGGRFDPMTVPKVMPNAAASQVSIRYGAQGPSFAVSSACSSGSQSIGIGARMIRSGMIDMAIVGGSEALLTPATFRAWELLRVLTPTACRPFSKGRDGMVLGEGAAVLVIEALETAEARGAPVIAEILGYGTTSDAGDLLRPDPAGAARAIALALFDAGLSAADIGYVNAHGTATVANDIAESEALRRVFGDHLGNLAVSSTKPIHGHTLGAAGAIELVVTVKAILEQIAPPTINWLGPDAKCGIDPVANEARPLAAAAAMSNSFAFGGINASLIVAPFR